MMGTEVRHPSQDQGRSAMPYYDVLIQQHVQTQAPEFRGPGRLTGVVLVITGDDIGTIPGTQPPERLDVRGKIAHRAVDKITRYGDEIRPETVHCIDYGSDIVSLDLEPT